MNISQLYIKQEYLQPSWLAVYALPVESQSKVLSEIERLVHCPFTNKGPIEVSVRYIIMKP